MTEPTQSRHRLALELLRSLRGEGDQSEEAEGSRPDDESTPESVALNHQKRGNRRFQYPVLRVLIGKETFNTHDWSLGGVMVARYVGEIKQNARFKLALSDGSTKGTYYTAEGRATRVDKKKLLLGVQFVSLSKGGFEWLSGLQLLQRSRAAKKLGG